MTSRGSATSIGRRSTRHATAPPTFGTPRTARRVARLDLARAHAAKDQPTIADLQGQLYDLHREVLYLRSKVASLSGR